MPKIDIRQHPLFIVFLLLAIVVIIGIGFFSANLNTINGQNTSITPIPKNYVTKAMSTTSNNSNPTVAQKSTHIYTGDGYQVAFPTDWTQDTDTPYDNTEGSMIEFQPRALSSDESPHVAVEINDAKDVSLASTSAGLSFLGFKKGITTIGKIPGERFSGTVTLSDKVLHNTIYLFSYNNQTYMIKLSYQGSGYDTQLEQEFTQFVNSFTAN